MEQDKFLGICPNKIESLWLQANTANGNVKSVFVSLRKDYAVTPRHGIVGRLALERHMGTSDSNRLASFKSKCDVFR